MVKHKLSYLHSAERQHKTRTKHTARCKHASYTQHPSTRVVCSWQKCLKYWAFRSDVSNSASVSIFHLRTARLGPGDVVRCMVSDDAVRTAELSPAMIVLSTKTAVWDVWVSSYEVHTKSSDVWLMCCRNYFISHWSSASFDCQRFWQRLSN